MTRFVTELDKRPDMPVTDAAKGRLGKRLVALFTTTTKPSSTQVNPINRFYF